MKCKICQHDSLPYHKETILKKYDVTYFKCEHCGFVQTEDPYWLPEAYENAITNLDIGLVTRNMYLREIVPELLDAFFSDARSMVDYGGGYGLFVRMMRDLGYNFFRQDIHCKNLFAEYFDIQDTQQTSFDILTSFEVFEHLGQPMEEIEKMFKLAENIIFTTQIAPKNSEDFKAWWYLIPSTGQHVAFYTEASLEFIAKKYNKHLTTNGNNLHVFSAKKLPEPRALNILLQKKESSFFSNLLKRLIPPVPQRGSLLQVDYENVVSKFGKRL